MMFNFKVPDDTFTIYVNKYGVPGCYAAMKKAVEYFKDVDKEDRTILVAGDTRRALEAVFMTTIDDSNKLLKLVQNMNTVKLGDVEMSFSSDQLDRLAMQAKFHGRTTEQYIRETVTELTAAMLERV